MLIEKGETILDEAKRLVYGDRGDDYGHPYNDFSRTAKMWSAILGVEVPVRLVPLMMCALKLSREVNKPKRDNLVDGSGYLATAEMVLDRENELQKIKERNNHDNGYDADISSVVGGRTKDIKRQRPEHDQKRSYDPLAGKNIRRNQKQNKIFRYSDKLSKYG